MKGSKFIKVHMNKKTRQFTIALPKKELRFLPIKIKFGEEIFIRKDGLSKLKFTRRLKKND